jgi:hypothetical protein
MAEIQALKAQIKQNAELAKPKYVEGRSQRFISQKPAE